MMTPQTWFALAMLCALAGCSQATVPTTTPSAQQLLDAHEPRDIWLAAVFVNSTVQDSLPPSSLQKFRFSTDVLGNGSAARTKLGFLSTATGLDLWRIQDGDAVIYGEYSLKSQVHDIVVQEKIVGKGNDSSIVGWVGGYEVRFVKAGDTRALLHFGPYGLYSSGVTLQQDSAQPAGKRIMSFVHQSIIPLADAGGTMTFRLYNVSTEITVMFWGQATAQSDSQVLQAIREDPRYLQRDIERNPDLFIGDGRFGQISPMCGELVLKAHQPCMNPWERPLV